MKHISARDTGAQSYRITVGKGIRYNQTTEKLKDITPAPHDPPPSGI